MATETLRPSAPGDETSIESQLGTGAHWEQVDEVTPDAHTTVVYTSTNEWQRDLYNLPAHSEGSSTINFIKIYFRCYGYASYPGWGKPALKSNSTVTDGTQVDLNAGAFVTFSQQWNTNPADSQAWEWADIDALQIGVSINDGEAAGTRCTQVYVEIDYTPAYITNTMYLRHNPLGINIIKAGAG